MPDCVVRPLHPSSLDVFVEVPQNGTHKSRGGVHWAAGMIVAKLLSDKWAIKRSRVHKVTPREWRGLLFGDEKTSKEKCVEWGRQYADCASDDEAEAICIGEYGVMVTRA